jgi:hypothetical protein
VDLFGEDEMSRWDAVTMTPRIPLCGKVERSLDLHTCGELGNWRPFGCPVRHYKHRCWWGVGAHRLFLVPHSSHDLFAPLSP